MSALPTTVLFLLLVAAARAQNPADLPNQVGPTLSAAPFDTHQKFEYRFLQTVGLHGYLGAAAGAGIGQGLDRPREWGEGWGAFFTRYASGYGTNLARQSVAFGLEASLHEDPRYFPSEDKRLGVRLKNALLQTVVARGDSGKERFAWARMGSAFAAGEISRAWQPSSAQGFNHGLVSASVMLGGDFGYNLLQEFVPFLRPRGLHR